MCLFLKVKNLLPCTANIFKVIFTVFNVSDFPTAVSLYGLHLIAAPITIN